MTFSDDMADAMHIADQKKAMKECKWWGSVGFGGAFRHVPTGKVYVLMFAPPNNLFDLANGTYVWAPDVIDFTRPKNEQIEVGVLEFKTNKD